MVPFQENIDQGYQCKVKKKQRTTKVMCKKQLHYQISLWSQMPRFYCQFNSAYLTKLSLSKVKKEIYQEAPNQAWTTFGSGTHKANKNLGFETMPDSRIIWRQLC